MPKLEIDPFVSTERAIKLDPETSRILEERMKTADDGHMVSSEEARHRFKKWLSNSATTKTP